MRRIISSYDGWETELAPRLILGLWHPAFIRPALSYLPRLRRYHIGVSTKLARQYFWEACEGFSMRFAMLVGEEGQKFVRDCRAAGKEVCVWTVNDPSEMKTAITWGVHAVLTDKVAAFVKLRAEVSIYNGTTLIPGNCRSCITCNLRTCRLGLPLERLEILLPYTCMRRLARECLSSLTSTAFLARFFNIKIIRTYHRHAFTYSCGWSARSLMSCALFATDLVLFSRPTYPTLST